jgi:capsular exopolysaccharide synthesis family protein
MSEQSFFKERAETNQLVQVLQRYLPFWPLFVFTIGFGLMISWLRLRSQTRIYMASATVLLKDPQKGGGDSKVLEALNIFSEKKIVENEIIVLRSSLMLEEVARALDLYAAVYNQGRLRTEELYKSNSPIWFRALDKENIQGGGKFYFSVNWKKNSIKIRNEVIPFDSTITVANTTYRVIPNPDYARTLTGKNYYVIFNSVEGAAGAIAGGLRVNPISNASTVLELKMETPAPEKGVDVLNKIFEVYNEEAIEDKNQIAQRTLQFIGDRLNLVVGQLDSVEKNIETYKKNQGIYDLSGQASMYFNNVTELDKQNSEVELKLDVLKDVENYITKKGKKKGTVPSLLMINDPTLAGLLQRLYEAEFQVDKVESVNGEKSDAVILATGTVDRIKKDIRENLTNIRSNLMSVKNNVNSNIALNNGLLSTVPKKERGLLDISRQQAIKNNIYIFLLQKREETALSSAGTTPDLRVLEKGRAWGPIKPIAKKFYLSGILMGFLAAVLFVLLKESLNRRILFRADIEEKTNVPVLGEIIQTQTKDPIAISEGKKTVVAEQFRALRTNLSFMGLNENQKTLLVTSSISGEGKSFISMNLAMSLTLNGKKVALMEMDLRKPKLSKYFGVSRDPGITNYLIGKATIDEIIKTTEYPNLYVVSSGPIPPNPTELISSEKFKEMIGILKEKFDYLIIDSTPIGLVTDSQLLGPYADTTMYIVRHNLTPKVYLRLINDLYQQKKFNNMSIVFNGLKRRGFSFLNYGYSYGYGYGSGYGVDGNGYYSSGDGNNGWRNGWGLLRKAKKFFKKK